LVTKVNSFYRIDFNQEKLMLHRDMFLDIVKSRKISINRTQDTIDVFNSDNSLRGKLTEFNKLLKIILTVLVSSCMEEISFLSLWILKNIFTLFIHEYECICEFWLGTNERSYWFYDGLLLDFKRSPEAVGFKSICFYWKTFFFFNSIKASIDLGFAYVHRYFKLKKDDSRKLWWLQSV
jgi:hypothetical protein